MQVMFLGHHLRFGHFNTIFSCFLIDPYYNTLKTINWITTITNYINIKL